MLVFIAVTVAAFIYLVWWQALIVSAATFLLMILGARWFLIATMKRMMNFAHDMVDVKSRVLRGAKVDVHSVKQVQAPRELVEPSAEEGNTAEEIAEDRAYMAGRDWYAIELTIFPDPVNAGPMEHWDVDDLRLVPADAKPADLLAIDNDLPKAHDEEAAFAEVQVIDNGQPNDVADGKFVGPRRLRFVIDLPKGLGEVKFRYYFEQFGLIRLR
jgi:hypothetical protein